MSATRLTATCAVQLRQACRARIDELNITYVTVDNIAGLPEAMTSKLLCEPPQRQFTLATMFAMCGALALDPVLEHNGETLEKLKQKPQWMAPAREGKQYRIRMLRGAEHKIIRIEVTPKFMRKIAVLGNKSPKRTEEMRKRIATTAARARWMKTAAPAEVGQK